MAFRDRFMGLDDDPFFSSRRQHFGPMSGSPFDVHRHHRDHALMRREQRDPLFGMMMMDPFTRMQSMMSNFDNMFAAGQEGRGGGHSYSQSTVMHFSSSNGRDGRPQVYQASSSTRCAPGGIKESRKMERDSTTGIQKTFVSHQIGDKSRTVQREVNLQTNEREENKEYINLTEEDEQTFSREWDEKARSYSRSLGGPSRRDHYAHSMGLPSEPTHRQDRGIFVDHTHSSPPTYPRMQPYSMDNGQRRKRDKKTAKVTFD